MDKLIEMKNITKNFGKEVILQNLNMTINKGDSIAIVGHNGCGKSTLLKIISGLVSIKEGEIKYHKDLKFNYVPERFPKLLITPNQYILRTGLIEGLTKDEIKSRGYELFKNFFMENMIDIPIKYLSKGSIQKVSVVQALLTKPDILLLDEPLSGQDVDSQRVFIKLVNKLIGEGVTVVMSCHDNILIDSLANLVYKIKDRNIEKVKNIKRENKSYDILVFRKNMKLEEKYKNIKEKIEKIEIDEKKIKMVVSCDNSNLVVKEMLDYGYEIRRMYNENF
ncbi:ATP-binding cassette domain-containing protein [Clostridium oceanicum]|uniref:ABC transporter ATP-binding protein n=1 Tax=Clostridium oceanicum TaxID=1543 RepID=A0ABP3UX96_9CLOT